MKKKTTRYLFAALLIAAPGFVLAAQSYPARPVRIVVPVPAGGGVDALARVVGQHLNAVWGQPFIVDNRPGAGGSLGAEIAARATPDGYTLMVSSSSLAESPGRTRRRRGASPALSTVSLTSNTRLGVARRIRLLGC